jgi:hypothetical protein
MLRDNTNDRQVHLGLDKLRKPTMIKTDRAPTLYPAAKTAPGGTAYITIFFSDREARAAGKRSLDSDGTPRDTPLKWTPGPTCPRPNGTSFFNDAAAYRELACLCADFMPQAALS